MSVLQCQIDYDSANVYLNTHGGLTYNAIQCVMHIIKATVLKLTMCECMMQFLYKDLVRDSIAEM